jgi:hypothetical protein
MRVSVPPGPGHTAHSLDTDYDETLKKNFTNFRLRVRVRLPHIQLVIYLYYLALLSDTCPFALPMCQNVDPFKKYLCSNFRCALYYVSASRTTDLAWEGEESFSSKVL